MKKILIFIFCMIGYFANAQIYTNPSFTYNGQTYKVSSSHRLIFITNTANKSGTFPPVTGNYYACLTSDVIDWRYLLQKGKEAINGAIDAQTRTDIRNNETFDVDLIVTKENKVEVMFILKSNTIITPDQIYAMDMTIRQIPITFNPTGNCVGINLSTVRIPLPNQPSTDQ